MSGEKKAGKIVPLHQDHSFFHKRAVRYADKDDLEQAAYFAVRALEIDPKNHETRMELAGTYALMERFDASNALLINLIADGYYDLAECWYGLGSNLAAQMQYGMARDCLYRSLELDADSLRAEEVQDLLDAIDEYALSDDRSTWYLHHQVMRARALLDKGYIEDAEKLFEQLDLADPLFMDIRNDYALCLYILGDCAEAVRLEESVIAEYENDIQALCNLADFMRIGQRMEEAEAYLARVEKLSFDRDMESPADLLYVAKTLYRAERYDAALTRLNSLNRLVPCEPRGMHLLAACHMMMGNYEKAAAIWHRMTRIDPNDLSAAHYYRHAKRLKDVGGTTKNFHLDMISPQGELPDWLIRDNLQKINALLENMEQAKKVWNSDPSVKKLIRWGCAQRQLRQTLMIFLCVMGDDDAEALLRYMLLLPEESEEFKKQTCAALKTMNAKEPYYLGLIDAMPRVSVEKRDMTREEEDDVYQRIMDHMEDPSDSVRYGIRKILDRYYKHRSQETMIRSRAALAAVTEYCFLTKVEEVRVTKSSLIRDYGTTLPTFNRALVRLIRAVEKEWEEKE